jgi:hypothetical protein
VFLNHALYIFSVSSNPLINWEELMSDTINASKETLKIIVMLGTIWGLAEAGLGFAVKGVCGYKMTGSVMTSFAIMFMAAGYTYSRRYSSVAIMLALASGMKIIGAVIMQKPLMGGGVANPIYAFITEASALSLLFWLMKDVEVKNYKRNAVFGGLTALVAINLFPFVGSFTGNVACNTNNYPWALLYAPISVFLTAVLYPVGILTGNALREMTVEKIFCVSKNLIVDAVSVTAFSCAIILQFSLR